MDGINNVFVVILVDDVALMGQSMRLLVESSTRDLKVTFKEDGDYWVAQAVRRSRRRRPDSVITHPRGPAQGDTGESGRGLLCHQLVTAGFVFNTTSTKVASIAMASRSAATLLRSMRLAKSSAVTRALTSSIPRTLASPGTAATAPAARCHSTFSSVSPDEVEHFNALAADWWDPHGSSRLLHLMNPLRHAFIRDCLASQPDAPTSPPRRFLDVGCGGGIFAESAARLHDTHAVTAIDPTPGVLAIAKSHAKRDPALRGKLEYKSATIETLPAAPERLYDIVSVFEVVEHVSSPEEFLDRCAPFVRPGGWLVGSTIARTWVSWFTTNFLAEDVLGIVPKGTHDWRKYINDHELKGMFMGKGWEMPRIMGVVYVPGCGWREVQGSEKVGNYFFGVRRAA
ncbi:Ubiquinone biosynthesis O-methyltransferase [Colletotrichum sidae]|uniref:Ubiquinone biosynthesis O-methyltransferase, mitochondrial n=1 Tax=Colletotrichum sidae TaxID=1347389 RepID=A0A4R8TDH3_9PEZI|nr:Ubiquinone biosynthesis O-methyltransferase [Colletotrichum sidae]